MQEDPAPQHLWWQRRLGAAQRGSDEPLEGSLSLKRAQPTGAGVRLRQGARQVGESRHARDTQP